MPDPVSPDDAPNDSTAGARRLVAESAPGDNAAPLSVGELALRLKRMVEGAFGHVRLRGEISGFKRAASGHAYLSLKDADAVIDAIIWKGSMAAIPFQPQDGVEVIATGKLTTYPGRSKYQIVIERMELAGEGALMALLEKLKAQLAAEGLFAAERKRRLPYIPRTIGIVTSPTGAVIRDMLHRLADRFPSHVVLWPVKVQGDGAAAEIARAIRGFGAIEASGAVPRPDLLIVARGGGSIEDLWAFNEEAVVRAIAESPIPVISAVGHETDTTLADYAADLRAPTPTAAAEMAVPVRAELQLTVEDMAVRAGRAMLRQHQRSAERLAATARLMPRRDALLGPQRQRADDLAQRLGLGLERRVTAARAALDRTAGVLRPAMLEQRLARGRERLAATWRLVESLGHQSVLARGYAYVTGIESGTVVADAAAARAAGQVTLHFRDGAVGANIDAAVEPGGGGGYAKPQARQPKRPPSDEAPRQPTLL